MLPQLIMVLWWSWPRSNRLQSRETILNLRKIAPTVWFFLDVAAVKIQIDLTDEKR